MDPNAWIVIALCFNVLVLAIGAITTSRNTKKEVFEERIKRIKAELKAELMEYMLGILIKDKCECAEKDCESDTKE